MSNDDYYNRKIVLDRWREYRSIALSKIQKIKPDAASDERIFYFCDQLAFRLVKFEHSLGGIDIPELILEEFLSLPVDVMTYIIAADRMDHIHDTFDEHEYSTVVKGKREG